MSRPTHWLIDGFNLHHSILQSTIAGEPPRLWIDPIALARSHQYLLGKQSHLGRVDYFSAVPDHLRMADLPAFERHRLHLRALTARRPACGVHLGHFQPRRGLEVRRAQQEGASGKQEGGRGGLRIKNEELKIGARWHGGSVAQRHS